MDEDEKEKKIRRTREKLVVKQRVSLPFISNVKLKVPLRSRVAKPINRSDHDDKKKKKIELFLVGVNKILIDF